MEEEDKPTVYAMNHGRIRWACQYYRLELPCEQLDKLGYAHTWSDTLENGFDESMASMSMSDYDLFWGVQGKHILDQVRILKAIKPLKRDNGKLKIPPILIYDTDDNRDYLHPHNTAFCTQGVRSYPDGKLLSPGSTLMSDDPITGKPHILWEDKVTHYGGSTFDIKRNLEDMKLSHKIFREVHAMTTPSPYLASYLKNVIGVKHVYVFPNTIVPEHYVSHDLVRKDDKVRILWQGGSSHLIDWFPLRHAIKEVLEKRPNTTIVLFGQLDDWMLQFIPLNRIEYHGWVDYSAYKLKRSLLNIDINLCPLVDNVFNRCKSAIKWYEASIWDRPEATLAAKVPPFSEEITDGHDALLYDSPTDFATKLIALIDDKDLRNKLSANAKQYVLSHRTPQHTIPPLWEFYQHVQQEQIGRILLSLK